MLGLTRFLQILFSLYTFYNLFRRITSLNCSYVDAASVKSYVQSKIFAYFILYHQFVSYRIFRYYNLFSLSSDYFHVVLLGCFIQLQKHYLKIICYIVREVYLLSVLAPFYFFTYQFIHNDVEQENMLASCSVLLSFNYIFRLFRISVTYSSLTRSSTKHVNSQMIVVLHRFLNCLATNIPSVVDRLFRKPWS